MSSGINILYIGYWAFDDGLTQSTIIPHLKVLIEISDVSSIVFTSLERDHVRSTHIFEKDRITHIPLRSRNLAINIINKLYDFILFPKQLEEICHTHHIDHIICRGAPAGALGYLVCEKTGIPFSVESFEPHADYMLESGTWSRWDPRYLMQKHWEKKQKQYATMLMPVADNYLYKLKKEGVVESKIRVQPCEVDPMKFDILNDRKENLRKQLIISNEAIVGVYVGKFGDIYWDEEAFNLFKSGLKFFKDQLHILVLSPQSISEIEAKFKKKGIQSNQYTILKASFEKVPDFLNISDFAFSLIKSTPNRKFCSPIKNGEYWACGLPVLIPDGIGDDSQILKETGLGVVMDDLSHPDKYFLQLETLINANKKEEIRQLAIKYRNPETTKNVYKKLIERLIKK